MVARGRKKPPDDFYKAYSAVKRSFARSQVYKEAMALAIDPKKHGPRGGKRYRCAECTKDFSNKDVQVDHIEPVVPLGVLMRDMTWCAIHHRTYCKLSNLQVLCTECHKVKSKEENSIRRKVKNTLTKAGCKLRLRSSLNPCRHGG